MSCPYPARAVLHPNRAVEGSGQCEFDEQEIKTLTQVTRELEPATKRGRKVQYDWSVFEIKFYVSLDDDAVAVNDDINVERRADDLMTWGERRLGELKTPKSAAMRAKVTEWAANWRRFKAADKN
jgi:hypothetical protein